MRATAHLRVLVIAACVLIVSSLVLAPRAHGSPASWSLAGLFERSSAPSFHPGFNPNDVDAIAVGYDDRAKTLDLALTFFEPPRRDPIEIALGNGRPDGTCATGTARIVIRGADIVRTRTEVVRVPYWVAGRTETRWTWTNRAPGWNWHSAGWDSWRGMWKWIRIQHGYTAYREETRTVTEVDPHAHLRTASLDRAGVDGTLEVTQEVATGATSYAWRFGSPRLDGLHADCLEIRIAGRAAPFVIPPPALPEPAPTPEPEPEPEPEPAPEVGEPVEEDPAPEVTASARRTGARVVVRLDGRRADRIQIRTGRSVRTLRWRKTLRVPGLPARTRSIGIRIRDDGRWTPWVRIVVRGGGRASG